MKFLFDLLPVILFFAAYKVGGANPEASHALAAGWLGDGIAVSQAPILIATFVAYTFLALDVIGGGPVSRADLSSQTQRDLAAVLEPGAALGNPVISHAPLDPARLQQALGVSRPRYLHTPLVLAPNGEKLSKQHGAPALDTRTPLPLLAQAAQVLSLPVPPSQALSDWLAHAVQAWSDRWAPRNL